MARDRKQAGLLRHLWQEGPQHSFRCSAPRSLDLAAARTPTNPLGVKGAGEAGTVGSLSAGVNAIVDALSVYGIRHIDTPCTAYRVWRAIQEPNNSLNPSS
jgi:hypothetical protein